MRMARPTEANHNELLTASPGVAGFYGSKDANVVVIRAFCQEELCELDICDKLTQWSLRGSRAWTDIQTNIPVLANGLK